MPEIISERIPLEVEGTPVCDIMIKSRIPARRTVLFLTWFESWQSMG